MIEKKRCVTSMIKCLVWDLDGTLWDGVLSDNQSVIKLRPRVSEVLQTLDKRGVLLSIASRNDFVLAMKALNAFNIDQYFLYPQCGWGSKVDSIKQIAACLDIAIESIAFIDDDPFEIHAIKTLLPMVHVYHADEYHLLLDYSEFQISHATHEAASRRHLMTLRQARIDAEREFQGVYEDFLRDCQMNLFVRIASADDISRACELASRTTQLNNIQGPVDLQTISSYISSEQKTMYVGELYDRFGNHGIVAVALVNINAVTLNIDLFCISCRIEGRGIGACFLGTVLNRLSKQTIDIEYAKCTYVSGTRNRPTLSLLKILGFTLQKTQYGTSNYVLKLPCEYISPDWIYIHFVEN